MTVSNGDGFAGDGDDDNHDQQRCEECGVVCYRIPYSRVGFTLSMHTTTFKLGHGDDDDDDGAHCIT